MIKNLGLPDPHDAEYIRVEALEDCGEILTTHSGVVTLTPGETTVYIFQDSNNIFHFCSTFVHFWYHFDQFCSAVTRLKRGDVEALIRVGKLKQI